MAEVHLNHIEKIYDNGVQAVWDFNLDVADGEFIVLVGPSGCGKSTTLRMVAGLEDISKGQLIIDGKDCTQLPPKDRDIAMVFQNYALYGHMTIYENMAFSLVLRKENKQVIHRKVMAAAEILDLKSQLNKKPKQLSGGQRQRVAMGRAIVRNPKVFLFDEPLSNLDAKLRGSMRREIMLLHKKLGSTMMYVTHDQTEALTLADRIVCMSMGHIQQIGKPIELYEQPANTFVATFIGLPPMNMFEGVVVNGKFVSEYFTYPLNEAQKKILKDSEGKQVLLGVRPENIVLDGNIDFTVTNNENLGMNTLVHGKIANQKIVVCKFASWCNYKFGDQIKIGFDEERMHFFEMPQENMFEGKVENGNFVSDYLTRPLTEKQKNILQDSEGKQVTFGVLPENIVLGGDMDLTVTNSENSGANTLVYGKIAGKKTVVCKFASKDTFKFGDQIKIGFDEKSMNFEMSKDKQPGKAIR
jgi:multiple sugar transport system ATP-binding protein